MTATELADQVDILEYISQYTDFEERNGEFWALSPLKSENTPSFVVSKELNRFYDFSSGSYGNAVQFVMDYNHCSLRKACDILTEYIGEENLVEKPKPLAVCDVARKFCDPKFIKHKPSHTFLSQDYMSRFEKDSQKLKIWIDEGISQKSLDKFQVYYDRVANRLVFPIRDRYGNIVNISGRTLDPQYKEKRLRKYTYYQKFGTMDLIYGLYENIDYINEQKEIILFEGAKSVMLTDTWGIHNTGAILTSHLNRDQAKILIGLGCTVVFALDKEVEVRKDKNIRWITQFVPVKYVIDSIDMLDEKMAPVDNGFKTWQVLYKEARNL